jgi:hypothetical protein
MTLRDLIASRPKWDCYQRLYERGLPGVEYRNQRDEVASFRGLATRSTLNIQKRTIERLLTLESQAHAQAFGTDPQERLAKYMQSFYMTATAPVPYSDSEIESGSVRWYRSKRHDVVNNFLYDRWLEQRSGGFRTYPVFAIYCTAKAIVELMTSYQNAHALLTELDSTLEQPTREMCLTIKQQPWYDDPEAFLGHIFAEKLILRWVEVALIRYGDLVRGIHHLEQIELPTFLPDDPLGFLPEQVAEDVVISHALTALAAGEGSADAIARRFGIGQKAFRRIAKERGIMRGHGGPRHRRKGL